MFLLKGHFLQGALIHIQVKELLSFSVLLPFQFGVELFNKGMDLPIREDSLLEGRQPPRKQTGSHRSCFPL